MAYGENKQLQIGLNVALASLFTVASISSYGWVQEKLSGSDPEQSVPMSSEELLIVDVYDQGLDSLTRYYGANENVEILIEPADTRNILDSHRFAQFSEDFYSVRDDYLFQLENGDVRGFDQLSGMIYGKDAIDAKSGKHPLNQLMAIKKTMETIEGLPEALKAEDNGHAMVSSDKAKRSDANPTKTSSNINNADSLKEKSIAKEFASVKPLSEDEIKAMFESKFGSKQSEGSSTQGPATENEASVVDQKVADIEKLRAELKKRIQKDFGYIPNAKQQIESHLGSTDASIQPRQNTSEPSNVRSNQVNVGAIRETRSAVIYKDQRIPKVGFDLEGNPVSEESKRAQVKGIMDRIVQMGDYWSVVYEAKGEEKKKIAVFSDPTCPYCKKLHEYVPELQEAGVTVYHLFYNRSMAPNTLNDPKVVKVNSALESAWCSEDPNESIDSLYDGYSIPPATCEASEEKIEFPGNEHYLMGRIIDMSGTPYTITEDGIIIPGFDVKGAPQPRSFLKAIGL